MNDQVALSPKEAVRIGASSLTRFGKLFFPRTVRQSSPRFHEEMDAGLVGPSRFNAWEVFRGGAKTTKLRVYTAQRVSYAISRTIMYIGASQPHAIFSVRWLKRQIMYNKKWASVFGLEPGSKWTDEHLEIKHNLAHDQHQPDMPVMITVLAMGVTGQVRGFNPDDYRPDLIILDDVLTDENTATPEQRKKIEDLIFGAILKSMAPESEAPTAKAVFLQTPFHNEDAIEKCMVDPQWNPVRYGILEYRQDMPPESRWPERFPTSTVLEDKAAHIRRSQYRLWMREMECALVSGEEKAINIEHFRHYEVLPEYLDCVYISLDPASADPKLNKSGKADEFAIAAVGFKGPDVYLLDYSSAVAMMPDKAANDTFSLVLLYSPQMIVVESNAYQRIMAWFLEQEMQKRRLYVAVDRLEVRTRNADRIMQTIPGLAAFGHFHIRPTHDKFIKQADDYNPGVREIKDDLLTAVANAIIRRNPNLYLHMAGADEGRVIDDESQYKTRMIRAAP